MKIDIEIIFAHVAEAFHRVGQDTLSNSEFLRLLDAPKRLSLDACQMVRQCLPAEGIGTEIEYNAFVEKLDAWLSKIPEGQEQLYSKKSWPKPSGEIVHQALKEHLMHPGQWKHLVNTQVAGPTLILSPNGQALRIKGIKKETVEQHFLRIAERLVTERKELNEIILKTLEPHELLDRARRDECITQITKAFAQTVPGSWLVPSKSPSTGHPIDVSCHTAVATAMQDVASWKSLEKDQFPDKRVAYRIFEMIDTTIQSMQEGIKNKQFIDYVPKIKAIEEVLQQARADRINFEEPDREKIQTRLQTLTVQYRAFMQAQTEHGLEALGTCFQQLTSAQQTRPSLSM